MDKKKKLQLIAFILGVLVLAKLMMVRDEDKVNSPVWEEVERAFNSRNDVYNANK